MFQSKYRSYKQNHLLSGGFGLVEMMVSIGILVLVMSVILANHQAFNHAVLLKSQAYEIAFKVREAQLFAVSVTGDSGDFRKVYGVHFNDSTSNGVYKVFRDNNATQNYYYDSVSEEFGEQGVLDPRFEVSDIRLLGSAVTPNDLSIIFTRPNFDARFFTGPLTEPANVTGAEIDVRLRGSTSPVYTIEITKTGQISVK
ncbi:MAG: prepilin-type N-terminal cleavage/methylation domain-containing protein [Candidatus Nomurabacteria bacterium]|nr:MAG: prepilin-type N-terminal cleavage/methylation domain-containing protein [Candidatus Nomurabacteria bacterium]